MNLKDGLKNLGSRVPFWVAVIVAAIMGDQWLKDGYLFKFSDLFSPEVVTHEKIAFLVLVFGAIVYGLTKTLPMTVDDL